MKNINCLIEVPIKGKKSQRVPGKNFRMLNKKPLFSWGLDMLLLAKELSLKKDISIDILIDSEEEFVHKLILDYYGKDLFKFYLRPKYLAEDNANGNNLIQNIGEEFTGKYDLLAQYYITAPFLRAKSIVESIEKFKISKCDSVFTASYEMGWYWWNKKAINYDPSSPNGLPRSQDAPMIKETTGFYVIKAPIAKQLGIRVGNNPLPFIVDGYESQDIDDEKDWEICEYIAKKLNN